MTKQKKTYELRGLKELLTPVIINEEKRYIRFKCHRNHPVLKRFNGILITDDQQLQKALESDKRYGKKWKRIHNFKFYVT